MKQNRLHKKIKATIPFTILFCIYIIIGSYGFGNDCDTYQMIRSGQELMSHGIYSPSRPPGLLIPDIIVGSSSFIGGSLFSNTLSAIFGILSLYIFWILLKKHHEGFDALLIVSIIGLNPHFIMGIRESV